MPGSGRQVPRDGPAPGRSEGQAGERPVCGGESQGGWRVQREVRPVLVRMWAVTVTLVAVSENGLRGSRAGAGTAARRLVVGAKPCCPGAERRQSSGSSGGGTHRIR